jgi:sec-independent protein translocase protein TatC
MKNMTMMQHFSELRRRILWSLGFFAIAFVIGWYVAPITQVFLTLPLLNVWPGGVLLYTGLTDGLMIRLSMAGLVALIAIIPVLLWHFWAFVGPGLKQTEKKVILPILIMSPILFLCGAGFAFYFLLPLMFKFFVDLNQVTDAPNVIMPAVRDYLHFAIGMLKVFGVAFQLPLVLVLLNRIGLLKKAQVLRMRRYAIVIIVIVAAVLTPPDVVSQLLLAVPMWLLFEFSILFMRHD